MTGCYIGCGDDRALHWVWGRQGITLGVGMKGCYIGCGDGMVLRWVWG